MSIVKLNAPGLSIAPHVVVGQNWLSARTHRLWSLLSLFSYQRELWVDAGQRRVRLRERKWWKTREMQLGIDAIDHIDYRYIGLPTAFYPHVQRYRQTTLETADRMDRFQIALVLKSGEHLPLFTFIGEGSVSTGLVGTLLGDSWLDLEGKQEEQARGFVEHLMRLTQLGLGPSLPRQAAERRGMRCFQCGQTNAPRARCLYCGAALEGGSSAPSHG
ncbi:MAG TPA: hypothetical protein VMG12_03100 [Polyangiaceae bacterium]|nr:hypothetical protein [Polyangiaceae bacterium]